MKYKLEDLFNEEKLKSLAKDEKEFISMNILFDMLPLKKMMEFNIEINPEFVRNVPCYINTEEAVKFLFNENCLTGDEEIELSNILQETTNVVDYSHLLSSPAVLNSWFRKTGVSRNLSKIVSKILKIQPLNATILNNMSDHLLNIVFYESGSNKEHSETLLITLFNALSKEEIKKLSPAFLISEKIGKFLTLENKYEDYLKNVAVSKYSGVYEFIVTGNKSIPLKFAENYVKFEDDIVFHYIDGQVLSDLSRFGDFFIEFNKNVKELGGREVSIERFIKSLNETVFFKRMLNESDSYLLLEKNKHGKDYSIGDFYSKMITDSSSYYFTDKMDAYSILSRTDKSLTRLYYIFANKNKSYHIQNNFLEIVKPDDWKNVESLISDAKYESSIFRKSPLAFMKIEDINNMRAFLSIESELPENIRKSIYQMFNKENFSLSYNLPSFVLSKNLTKFMKGALAEMPESLNKWLIKREILIHAKKLTQSIPEEDLDFWVSEFNIPSQIKESINKVFVKKVFNEDDIQHLSAYGHPDFNILNLAFNVKNNQLGSFNARQCLKRNNIEINVKNDISEIWENLHLFKNITDSDLSLLPENRFASEFIKQMLFLGESLEDSKDGLYYEMDMAGEFSLNVKENTNWESIANAQYFISAYLRKATNYHVENFNDDSLNDNIVTEAIKKLKSTHANNINMVKAFEALNQKMDVDKNNPLYLNNSQSELIGLNIVEDIFGLIESKVFEVTPKDWVKHFKRIFKPESIIDLTHSVASRIERVQNYSKSDREAIRGQLIEQCPAVFIECANRKMTKELNEQNDKGISLDFTLKNWDEVEVFLMSIYKNDIELPELSRKGNNSGREYTMGIIGAITSALGEKDVSSFINLVEKSKIENIGLYSFLVSEEIMWAMSAVNKKVSSLNYLINQGVMRDGIQIIIENQSGLITEKTSLVLNSVVRSISSLDSCNGEGYSYFVADSNKKEDKGRDKVLDNVIVNFLQVIDWEDLSIELITQELNKLGKKSRITESLMESYIQKLGETDNGVSYLNHLIEKSESFSSLFNVEKINLDNMLFLEEGMVGEKIRTRYNLLLKAVLIKSEISKGFQEGLVPTNTGDSNKDFQDFKL